uniref:PAP-associated domain-containing protein n=1 Tax=Mesocestoides corti TaxID=53468 RepID=A0A5K3FIS9_MESCO
MNEYVNHGAPSAHYSHSQSYKYRRGGGGGGSSSSSHYMPLQPPSVMPIYHHPMTPRVVAAPGPPFNVCNFNCSVPIIPQQLTLPPPPNLHENTPPAPRLESGGCEQDDATETSPSTTSISTQTPSSTPPQKSLQNPVAQLQCYPVLSYLDSLSVYMWQYFLETRQTQTKYSRKVHFRNALHMIISAVFGNSKLFIVGSSINGFGSDQSDMDLCLVLTSEELQARREASVVLHQLMIPLRKCSFIKKCILIRAKVPILKFRDQLSGVDCDLNINNVVGIYNTHLLAMYTRVDWRVRPLGMFVKHWAQKMDIHDGSRGRLSTYPLLLMLIQFLQCGCSPPVLPNLQARFPKIFTYERSVGELDMRLQLPWGELSSSNTATLAELFAGFISYYAAFDFNQWAISIKHGQPLPIDVALDCLPLHERVHTSCSFKIFVEGQFIQSRWKTSSPTRIHTTTVAFVVERDINQTVVAFRAL